MGYNPPKKDYTKLTLKVVVATQILQALLIAVLLVREFG